MTLSDQADLKSAAALKILAVFLIGVLGSGLLIGSLTDTSGWFDSLQKPFFNPPSWVFAPVWSTLYVLIAIAGWRIYQHKPRSRLWGLWCGQMALNFAWTPLFFMLHLVWVAFGVLVLMLLLILLVISHNWQSDRVSVWLFVPYAVWVGFAGLLNLSIAILN